MQTKESDYSKYTNMLQSTVTSSLTVQKFRSKQ